MWKFDESTSLSPCCLAPQPCMEFLVVEKLSQAHPRNLLVLQCSCSDAVSSDCICLFQRQNERSDQSETSFDTKRRRYYMNLLQKLEEEDGNRYEQGFICQTLDNGNSLVGKGATKSPLMSAS